MMTLPYVHDLISKYKEASRFQRLSEEISLRDPWLGETDRCGRSRQEVRGGENREAPPRLAIGASPMG